MNPSQQPIFPNQSVPPSGVQPVPMAGNSYAPPTESLELTPAVTVPTTEPLINQPSFSGSAAPFTPTPLPPSAGVKMPKPPKLAWVLLIVSLAALAGMGILLLQRNTNAPTSSFSSQNQQTANQANLGNLKDQSVSFGIDTTIANGKTLTATGPVVIQNAADSLAAFKIQNSSGFNLLVADTANGRVGIGQAPTGSAALQVSGDISATGTITSKGAVLSSGSLSADNGQTTLDNSGLTINSALVCTSIGCKPLGQVFNGDSTSLGGHGSNYFTNATNINSGTLNDSVLPTNVALLDSNQTFNGINSFTAAGNVFVGDGSGISAVNAASLGGQTASYFTNASNLSSGTIANSRLSTNVTLAGNSFNTSNGLVMLDSAGLLPVLDGSALTNLNASALSIGTIADTRLSANVALLNANNSFTGNNDFTSILKVKNTSTSAFQVQKADGTGNLLVADTSNGRLAIGQASANYTLDVNGTINSATGFRVAGAAGSSLNCTSGDLVQNAVINGGIITGGTCVAPTVVSTPTLQQVYDSSTSSPQITLNSNGGLIIQDASVSVGGNLFAVQDKGGASNYLAITTTGANVTGDVDITGQYKVNGLQISTSNLSNGSYIALINGNNTFSGNNSFTSSGNSFAGNGSGLTSVDAATLGGFSAPYFTNATNISTGTLSDARLTANVALLNRANQSFSGNNTYTGTLAVNNTGTAAFQVQKSDGSGNLLVADTTDGRVAIGVASPSYTLDVAGDVNSSTGYRVAGVAGSSINCSGGDFLQNASVSGGIVTGGSCTAPAAPTTPTFQQVYDATVTSPQITLGATGGFIIQDASTPIVGDLFAVQENSANGPTKYFEITSSGVSVTGDVSVSGAVNAASLSGNGASITALNASNISAGTIGDVYLNSDVTKQGNSFNGANQLVQLDGTSQLPSVSGVNLTNLNASNVASGTLNNSRLSSQVVLNNQNNTLAGNLAVNATGLTAFQIQNSSGVGNLLVADTTDTRIAIGQATASYTLDVAGDINTTTGYRVAGTSGASTTCSSGNVLSNITVAGGIITGGSCATNGAGATTTLQQAYDNSSSPATIATSSAAKSIIFKAGTGNDSTSLFQIQDAAGTSNLLVADTTDTRIAIGQATAGYTLDVAGDINSTTGLRVGGQLVCTSAGCNATTGSGNYIQNGTGTQTNGNFNIRSANSSYVGGVIEGASGQTADLLDVQSFNGTTKYLAVKTTGLSVTGNVNVTGQYQVGGSQISSANLSNDSNLTKNSANNTLSGSNTFTGYNAYAPSTDITGLTVKQTTAGSPTSDVFDVTNAAGTTVFLKVGSNGNINASGTINAVTLQQNGVNVLTTGTTFAGDVSGAYNALTIGTGKVTSTNILDGTIANADISNSAAIAYSKLSLGGSIVNTDISSSAAIAYSKLALTNSITNSDISTTAAIAYSKLSLSNSIVNADISSSAAIADSKLATISSAGKVADTALSSNIARLNASDTFTNTVAVNNTGTAAFQIQKSDGTGNLLVADTTNGRISIGQASGSYALDVAGDINSTTGLRVGGNLICDSTGCNLKSGSTGNYIENGTATQTANFNVRSASASSVAGVVEAASGQTVDILDVQSYTGTTKYLAIDKNGNITASGTFNAATLQQGGTAVLLQNTNFGGDVSGTYGSLTIAANAVTNTKIADSSVTSAKISDGTIANVDISTSAAIAYSKLSLSNSIVNADISSSAAIADSKLATISSAGKVADTALSNNVAFLNANNTFAGNNTFTGTLLQKNTATTAFQLQKADGTGTVFTADTTDTRVAIGQASAAYTLDVNGDVNVTSGHNFRIAGASICSASGCTSTGDVGGSNYYIQNGTSPQTANFNITGNGVIGGTLGVTGDSTASGNFSVGGTLQGVGSSALTITSAAATTWSTASGTLTLQGGGGLVLSAAGANLIGFNVNGSVQASIDSNGNFTLTGNGLIVAGSKTADPTCTAGSIYYNTSTASFRGCQSTPSSWQDLLTPVGTVVPYAGSTAPDGYLIADGSSLSTTTYSRLFAVIGYTYGGSGGSFNLPDLRGRSAVGLNTSETGRSDVNALGKNEGAAIGNRTPVHMHTVVQPTINRTANVTLNDPGHTHSYTGGPIYTDAAIPYGMQPGGPTTVPNSPNGSLAISSNTTGITISQQPSFSASGGTVGPQSGTPLDTSAFLTLNYIIKF